MFGLSLRTRSAAVTRGVRPNFPASAMHRRPHTLQPSRGVVMLAFKGGIAAVSAAAAYISYQVAIRSRQAQLRYIRRVLNTPVNTNPDRSKLWMARLKQQGRLRELVQTGPSRPLFVFGPDGAGKSDLIRGVLHGRKNTFYIDLREQPVSSGQDFLSSFLTRSGYLFAPTDVLGRIVFRGTRAREAVQEEIDTGLAYLTQCLREQKAAGWPHGGPPLICIDELQRHWQQRQDQQPEPHLLMSTQGMQKFLDWCIFLSDNQLCHVWFVLPSFALPRMEALPGWRSRRETFYVDYMPRARVRQYLEHTVNSTLQERGYPKLSADDVEAVAEVVGGHLKDLTSVVAGLLRGREVETLLNFAVSDAVAMVENQLEQVLVAPVNEDRGERYRNALRYVRLWNLIRLVAERRFVSRREIVTALYRNHTKELDACIDSGLLLSVDSRYAMKHAFSQQNAPEEEQRQQQLQREQITDTYNLALDHGIRVGEGGGKFLSPASPRLRHAMRLLAIHPVMLERAEGVTLELRRSQLERKVSRELEQLAESSTRAVFWQRERELLQKPQQGEEEAEDYWPHAGSQSEQQGIAQAETGAGAGAEVDTTGAGMNRRAQISRACARHEELVAAEAALCDSIAASRAELQQIWKKTRSERGFRVRALLQERTSQDGVLAFYAYGGGEDSNGGSGNGGSGAASNVARSRGAVSSGSGGAKQP